MDIEQDTTKELYYLYEMMVQDHPEWAYAQRMAGITQYEKGNYSGADAFLKNTLELDQTDAVAWYYLGAISCEQGAPEYGKKCFVQAVENGASEELLSWIAWYMERMEEE